MGTGENLRVRSFIIDSESIGLLKQLSLVVTMAILGDFFHLHNS